MTTVSQAVATRSKADQIVTWLRGQQADLAMAAASHIKPSTLVRVTQGALRRDEKLMRAAIANPQSLLYALLECARLGHEPDTDQYYLVPFGNEVTGIEGYKGIVERMFRAGAVSAVVAETVRRDDVYRRRGATLPPAHEFDEFADPTDRGPLRGAYAYAVMLDGRYSKVVAMGRAEIMRHKAASKGSDRADSPWQQWEEAMWKKCPLRGLEPYVPTSSEWRREQIRAAAVVAAENGGSAPAILSPRAEPQPEPPRVVQATAQPARAETFEDAAPPEDVPLPDETGEEPPTVATKRQKDALFALFGDAGWNGDEYRDKRLTVLSVISVPEGWQPLNDLTSSNDLTSTQADRAAKRLRDIKRKSAGEKEFAAALEAIATSGEAGGGAETASPPPSPGGDAT